MRGRSARRASLTSTQRPPVRLPRARQGALLVVLLDGVEKELGEKQTLTVERCWRGRGRQPVDVDAAAAARPTTRTSKCGLPMVHRSAASCDSVTLKTPGGARGSGGVGRRCLGRCELEVARPGPFGAHCGRPERVWRLLVQPAARWARAVRSPTERVLSRLTHRMGEIGSIRSSVSHPRPPSRPHLLANPVVPTYYERDF